jgi:hypothetical protein
MYETQLSMDTIRDQTRELERMFIDILAKKNKTFFYINIHKAEWHKYEFNIINHYSIDHFLTNFFLLFKKQIHKIQRL